ncbi:MAG: hypothetical protein K0S41_755 [Anaerocolumna sp.]|jgi:hypothetical protein|nr:hypothetical protein [Anaerocolumna sp.]
MLARLMVKVIANHNTYKFLSRMQVSAIAFLIGIFLFILRCTKPNK